MSPACQGRGAERVPLLRATDRGRDVLLQGVAAPRFRPQSCVLIRLLVLSATTASRQSHAPGVFYSREILRGRERHRVIM